MSRGGGIGVNVTGSAFGRGRSEGLEVMLTHGDPPLSRGTAAADRPAPAATPPEDRLPELPVLTRRAVARLVLTEITKADEQWVGHVLRGLADRDGVPDGAQRVLRELGQLVATIGTERRHEALLAEMGR